MWVMHNLYENGKGVRQDLAEADRWLLKGAEGGSLRAQTSLGYHHEYPSHDSGHRVGDGAASMAEAVKWYRRAADQNWADGQYRLASCYLEGKGVEPDEEHGLQLMRAAADKGHAKALVDLVELYAQGVGEPRNPDDEPMQLLERAVQVREEGPYGVYNRPYDLLIFRLEFGIRTARDLVAAAEWYCRAALAGAYNYSLEDKLNYSPSARRPLWSATGLAGHSPVQVVTTGGSGPDAPLSELLSVYLRAARPNGGKDALSIAERFGAARDVPVSPTRAWVWFHLAVQRGASEGAAQCRALEQKLTPAELAEARRQYDRLVEHLDAVWQVIRHNAEPHGSGRTN
jgi:TPR repeat protein